MVGRYVLYVMAVCCVVMRCTVCYGGVLCVMAVYCVVNKYIVW